MARRRSDGRPATEGPPTQLHEIMNTNVVTIEPNESASVAWSRMQRHRIRHLVVTEKGRLRDVISERDLGGPNRPDIREGCLVYDLMTPRVVSAESTMTLRQAADLMREQPIGCLPVLEDGRLVGLVTPSDVFDELGRSSTRASFPGWFPKELKQKSSRSGVPVIPIHIRALGSNLTKEQRARIRQKLGKKLGKFASAIERVSVRVKDVNGPRGGIDQLCRIKVVLSNLPSVVFERQDASLEAAIEGAIDGTERAVRRSLERRRPKPIKVGTRATTRLGGTEP